MSRDACDDFSARVLAWYDRHGRKHLPWQMPREAYRVWVSEIMLQQTQVATVVPYFERFMRRFPDATALASAPIDDVLQLWAGLGYYARARNLHRAARIVRDRYDGRLPQDFDGLVDLPGIGRSTAGAILALAHGRRYPILDGNVKRLLARYHAVPGWPGETAVARRLWALSDTHTPVRRVADYTQAVMDIGATVCTRSRPVCDLCPLSETCIAFAQGRIDAYPEPRPKRARPLRQARMLVLARADGSVLLERRAPAGVWGGLWCFPEIEDDVAVEAWCRGRLGVDAQVVAHGPMIRHGFTHFELDIEPIYAKLGGAGAAVMEGPERLWYDVGHRNRPGVPVPVKKLLDRLRDEDPQWLLSTHSGNMGKR